MLQNLAAFLLRILSDSEFSENSYEQVFSKQNLHNHIFAHAAKATSPTSPSVQLLHYMQMYEKSVGFRFICYLLANSKLSKEFHYSISMNR